MNRLIMIYGCVLLSGSAIAAIPGSPWETIPLNEMAQNLEWHEDFEVAEDDRTAKSWGASIHSNSKDEEVYDLDISKIEFIEEETIDLGFDPCDYLPKHFDPYSYYFDLSTIEFDEGDDFIIDFDTAEYLPSGFDAYKEMMALSSIHFIEEEDIALGFDTKKYLPSGFSPYGSYFDLNSIVYIEMDDLDDEFLALPDEVSIIEEPLY